MIESNLHATCVDLDGKGVLITGASGSGKSALALQLIALGAGLVADDQTRIERDGPILWASRPATLPSLIEARGIGLINAPMVPRTAIKLAINMDELAVDRLPPPRHVTHLGCDIPLCHRVDGLHFASAIATMMRYGWPQP